MESRQEQGQSPSLDDCLKLLKGERDEQRLAGLLLDTKFCKGEDVASLRKVYDADLDSISDACENSWEQDKRNLTEMVCISTCVMKTTVLMMMELAMKMVQYMLRKLPQDSITNKCLSELPMVVVPIARQFAVLHIQLKFEDILSDIFSSKYLQLLHDALCVMAGNNWPNYMRVGIVAILQNRVEERIGENTFIKVINGLNETINVLLEYLKDVKVVECLIIVIRPCCYTVEDDSSIFLACNTIMNLLLKKEQVQFPVDESTVADLLMALGYWAEDANDPSVLMMASSICALLFDYTSEEALLYHPNFERSSLCHLSQLIARSLAFSKLVN
ncbi:hypothetical protein GH714_023359 [Hevea brasiliensis]|uniref:Neurochondrin n=1 Tax=Hevea brasiliensis TaxID=3981 RepID=A0A6A6LVW9_HEVBR|nr:hypothetical protein GH714_023359 [Hevea brasiliensis]